MSTVPKLTEEREKLRELVPETIKESDDTEENNKTVQNIVNNSSEARNDGNIISLFITAFFFKSRLSRTRTSSETP